MIRSTETTRTQTEVMEVAQPKGTPTTRGENHAEAKVIADQHKQVAKILRSTTEFDAL